MTELENEIPTVDESGEEISPAETEPESSATLAEPSEITEPNVPVEEAPVEDTQPEPEPEPGAGVEAEAPKEESKVRRFFRLLVRWTLGLLIVFGLGFLTAVYLLYQPEVQSNRVLQNQIQAEQQTAGEQAADLESQIGELQAQIDDLRPLAEENEALLAVQDGFELHIAILDARLDVSNALLALAVDDPARARVSLERTGEALTKVERLLPADQREIVTALQNRLELALNEMEDDPYAAQSDLDVLAKRLLEMEDGLFGSP